ncbi:reverse transcriptase domain-containing protein [Tanacetum coccineum]|uniref:Reverse transcriptase domain-containing protein n=1 Tax=Tanacetum coccineum TaxID=301880 RepID=A0ABQ4WCH0_9ASTR
MTPTARIKAIIELSKHLLSWYKEGDLMNNDLNVVFKQINNFEQNMNDISKEVRMTQHKYNVPDEGRISKLEETLSTFIKESRWKQRESDNLFWKLKRNYEKTFKKQASSIKTIEIHMGQITEIIHGRGVGSLPNFTETNLRGLTHAITTRSGLNYNLLKNPLEEINDTQDKTTENISKKERLRINIPFIEALEQMPKYAKFMKYLLTQRGRGQGGINKALADLGASISLMPYSMLLILNLGELKPTRMGIELANKSTQIPRGIAENVIVKIDKFVFPVDFVVLDMKEDRKIPIILGRPFPPSDDDKCHSVDMIDLSILDHVQEILPLESFDSLLFEPINHHLPTKINSLWDDNEGEHDLINQILGNLEPESEGYTKPTLFAANILNPKVQDIVKAEIVKLLDAGLIYAISDSPWVSPIHVVLKKGGITVVTNEDNELVPTHTVTGWRVCIDYRKLNDATRKDHFPLPFIDQMLERLYRNEYYCFLDGFSRYFQIPLALEDQEKTTFTCPYGTFA